MTVYLTDSALGQSQSWAQANGRLFWVMKNKTRQRPPSRHPPKHNVEAPAPRRELRLRDDDQGEQRPGPGHPLSATSALLPNPEP